MTIQRTLKFRDDLIIEKTPKAVMIKGILRSSQMWRMNMAIRHIFNDSDKRPRQFYKIDHMIDQGSQTQINTRTKKELAGRIPTKNVYVGCKRGLKVP